MGDVHGEIPKLNNFINKKSPDIILQCGDFGWWPSFPNNVDKKAKFKNTKVYFCDGNHEEHTFLEQDGLIHELCDNTFWCSRGSTLKLPDGRIVLFIGGASSTDKGYRKPGETWFQEEDITDDDMQRALEHDHVDIVISHTCPTKFKLDIAKIFVYGKIADRNRQFLDEILDRYVPSLWYFGHWHTHDYGIYGDTSWECFNYLGSRGKYFGYLPPKTSR